MRARQHARDGRLVAVTWNVWFSPTAFDQRLRALMREVLEAGADLVGFQEATPRFVAALLSAPWARAFRWGACMLALLEFAINLIP